MSFGVKLDRSCIYRGIVYALTGLVVGVDVGNVSDSRINAVAYYRIAVVLAGNVGETALEVDNRLVCTSVTVLELFRSSAVGKSHKLVTETYTEYRYTELLDLLDVFDYINVFRRISGAVREHNAVSAGTTTTSQPRLMSS